MSDANLTIIRYVAEVTWGEVPAGPPKFTDLRETSETFKGDKTTETSDEIDEDRNITEIIETGIGASGDLNFALSYASYEDFMLALLMAAAWSTPVAVLASGAVTVVALAGTFTIGTAWDADPAAAEWIRWEGFTEGGNNGYFKIDTATSSVITVLNKDDLVDEVAGSGISAVTGKQAVNGVERYSFAFEREHTDLVNVFDLLRGMMVDGMSWDIPARGKLTGSFSFLGRDEQPTAATAGDGAPNAKNTNPIISSGNDIQAINIDHSAVCVMTGTLDFVNSLREVLCAGTIAPNSLGLGRFITTGDLELLFTDNAQKTKFANHTDSGLALVIEDSLGNGIVLEVPSYQMTDDETNAEGVDTELSERISIEAHKDSTEGFTTKISLFVT